jgi:hypothetical protein
MSCTADRPPFDHFSSLPIPVLLIIHRLACQPGDLRCKLALEATCKQLRELFRDNSRISDLELHNIPSPLGSSALSSSAQAAGDAKRASFWLWLGAHGRRLDNLAIYLPWLARVGTLGSCPLLLHQEGLSGARALTVAVNAVDSFEVLAGLPNLVGLQCQLQAFCGGLEAASSSTTAQPLAAVPALRALTLFDCRRNSGTTPSTLSGLASVAQLTALSQLELQGSLPICSLDRLTSLAPALRSLHLQPARHLAADSLAPLTPFTSLTDFHLSLDRIDCVQSLLPIATLTNLAKLTISHCKTLPDAGLAPLASLQQTLQYLELDCIGSWTWLVDLSPLSSLAALEALHLVCSPVSTLQPIVCLRDTLHHLVMYDSEAPTNESPARLYDAISSLVNLKTLTVCGFRCNSLEFLRPLATSLENLGIDGEDEHSMDIMSALVALRQLTVLQQFGDASAEAVRRLSVLQRLTLDNDTSSSLAPLSALTALQELRLETMMHLTDVASLSALKNLRLLELGQVPHVTASSRRRLLSALPQLFIKDCSSMFQRCRERDGVFTVSVDGHCMCMR